MHNISRGDPKKINSRVRGIFVCLTGVGVRGLIFGICSIYEFIKFEFNSGFRPLPTPAPSRSRPSRFPHGFSFGN